MDRKKSPDCVPVPWERAAELHERLKQQGCLSTLHLNPSAREASLEPWPGNHERLVAALAGMDTARTQAG